MCAALKAEEVDYVPCSPFLNFLSERQRVGYRYQFPFPPTEREKVEYCVEELGVDPVVQCPFPIYKPGRDVSARVWTEKDVIHKVWNTPAGELRASVRYDEKWPCGRDIAFFDDFNTAHFVEPWLKSEQDVECLKYILQPPDDRDGMEQLRFDFDAAKRLADRHGLATYAHLMGLGLTGAMQLAGAEALCLMTIEKPGLVDAYLEVEHKLNLRKMEIACDLGIDIIRRNGFYETCDFYSPQMLEHFLAGRLKEEIDTVHEAGKIIGYTVHTGIMPMLDYLKRLDFDCLMHIDIAQKGIDLEKVRDSQEGKKSFWIGPCSTYHIWSKDAEDVRKAVRQVFEVFGKEGLTITACPSSHSIMPWENTLAMINEWKKLRGA
jgi:hypothetical protein